MRHYFSGAYYIRGGPSEVPFQMVQVIEELGGKVLVNAPVSEIIMNSGRAVGRCWQKSTVSVHVLEIYSKTWF